MAVPKSKIQRTTIEIFRDCLRLINHVGGKSDKAGAIRFHVRSEFKKNMREADPLKISIQKDCAIQGLSNYLVAHHMSKLTTRESVHRQAPIITQGNLGDNEIPKPRPRGADTD
jgi:hypothetical protein